MAEPYGICNRYFRRPVSYGKNPEFMANRFRQHLITSRIHTCFVNGNHYQEDEMDDNEEYRKAMEGTVTIRHCI